MTVLPADIARLRPAPVAHLQVTGRAGTIAFATGLGAAAALATGLRLFHLGSRSLWLDEAISVWAARLPWPALLPTVARHDDSPPLYFALLHLWLTFGDGEVWLRLLSVLCSLVAVVLGCLLATRLAGRAAGLLAAALLAISSAQVSYAQQARMYALVAALTPAVVYLALKTLSGGARPSPQSLVLSPKSLVPSSRPVGQRRARRRGYGWAVCWGLSLAALAATHHTAALVAAGTVAGGAILATASFARGHRAPAGAVAVAALVAAVAWSPLLPLLVAQTRHVAAHYWIPRPTPSYAAGEILAASIGTPPGAGHIQVSDPPSLDSPAGALYAALALPRMEPLRRVSLAMSAFSWLELPALAALVVAGLAGVRARAGGAAAVVLAAATVLPIVGLLVASQVRPILIARAMIGSGTLALVLIAVACVWLPRWLGAAALALVVCLQLLGLGEQWWYPFSEDWYAATGRLIAAARPGELVLVEGRWSRLPLDYYLRHHADLRLEEHGVPLDFGEGGKPEPVTTPADLPRIHALAAGRERVWFVASHNFDVDPGGLARKALETDFPCFDVWPHQGVTIALFSRC